MIESNEQYGEIQSCFQKIKEKVLAYFKQVDFSAFQHSSKSKGEIVTDTDREIERLIVDTIREFFPDHGIIGEEGSKFESQDGHTWFIDPVDNTVGLVADEDEVSVSVSLKNGDEHIYSLVINVKTGDIYEANGDGSFKNGEAIKTFDGDLEAKTRALSTCSYVNPVNIERWREIMKILLENRYPIRISGGAALDLCYIAEGKRAGHVSLGAHPWDVEAGFHIVKSAGGMVEVLKVFPERNSVAFVVSANDGVHAKIKQLLGSLIIFADGSK